MEMLYGWSIAAELNPAARYDQLVVALGGHGEYVTDPAAVGPAIDRAFAFDAGEISVGAGRVIGAHHLSAARPVSRTIRACQRRVIRSHADCGSTTVAVAPTSVECANRAVDRLARASQRPRRRRCPRSLSAA